MTRAFVLVAVSIGLVGMAMRAGPARCAVCDHNMGHGKTFDANATTPMPAGSFMVMPKDAPHYAWARGETVLQVHAIGPWGLTYVNPGDDPRKPR